MTTRSRIAQPRTTQQREDEGLIYAHLCIRVMERFLAATNAHPDLERHYFDLLPLYMDVLQDELAPYAFDLAYALFSNDKIAAKARRARAGK